MIDIFRFLCFNVSDIKVEIKKTSKFNVII